MEPDLIRIRGARMHSLKNISVDLPRNRLIVFTGISGSGKSTLAFDTLYAEGQRRYVESLSTYARQFLGQMEKPDVDSLEGLSPAVSIEQRTTSRNPRSTVGTITEIYDHLRLLFARAGRPHCPECGREIRSQSIQEMTAGLAARPEGTRLMIMAPLAEGKKGTHKDLFDRLRKEGYVRVRVDGQIRTLEEEIVLDKNKRHTVEAVIDRIMIKPGCERRLSESISAAVALAEGFLLVNYPDTNSDELMSEHAACIECGRSMPALEPQLFSFNNPRGACPECSGLGVKQFFDPTLIIANPTLSIEDGAIAAWGRMGSETYTMQQIEAVAAHYGFDTRTPFNRLPEAARHIILHGSGPDAIKVHYRREHRKVDYEAPFEGVLPNLSRRYRETQSSYIRQELEKFMNEQVCAVCHGARLKPEPLAVRIGPWNIHEICLMSIDELAHGLTRLDLGVREMVIAERVLKEIGDRLTFLLNVGLGYLSLGRSASSLSGGEAQRIRLASQIGSRLVGVLYILDEPSIGLHQRDNDRLIHTLESLRDLGNTVIVVEHDADTIRAADHVLDMGPGAGVHGGNVVYNGPVAGLVTEENSVTGAYLSGRLAIEVPATRRQGRKECITIKNARRNNLKGIDIAIPLGLFTCVTGVSGSGKSSLVMETLFTGAFQRLHGAENTNDRMKKVARAPGKAQQRPTDRMEDVSQAPEMAQQRPAGQEFDDILGLDRIDKVIDIDQNPIGRTPRSNPATYTGVLGPIRDLLARLPEARARGYQPGRFSFNIKGGRCEVCEGDGVIRIAMHFLPDIYVTCEACRGKRFNEDTLEIKYRDKNIAQILEMNVEEALDFFKNIPAIKNKLTTLSDVGLGYLTLGQSSVTLSGGEAQRIKLARELSRRDTGMTLYILDEPTTGLHPADIKNLLVVLNRLVDKNNTVVVIEHNLDVIKAADHVIDLGPEGGDGGGRLVAHGPPEKIMLCPESHTGRYLKKELGGGE